MIKKKIIWLTFQAIYRKIIMYKNKQYHIILEIQMKNPTFNRKMFFKKKIFKIKISLKSKFNWKIKIKFLKNLVI